MMKKFRKKPVVIEAIHFTEENKIQVYHTLLEIKQNITSSLYKDVPCLIIPTLEGEMIANLGDWIIKGVKGELYPCKPDIFEATYEEVAETETQGGST